MAETLFTYSGPPSGISVPGPGAEPREEMLLAGRELPLPADHPRVRHLVDAGLLTAAKPAAAPSSTEEDPAPAPASAGRGKSRNRSTENG